MKKSILFFLTLLSPVSLLALPLGNPAEPAFFNTGIFFTCPRSEGWLGGILAFHGGYYGDFVFNRRLKIDGPGQVDPLTGKSVGRGIKETRIFTNAGYLAVNFCNRADIFVTLGASKIALETNEGAWTANGRGNSIVQFKNAFSWSVGARGILYKLGCWRWGLEGQYFSTRPKFNDYHLQFLNQILYFNDAPRTHYFEWQVGSGICYEFRPCGTDFVIVPYVGVKWAGCKFITHQFTFLPGPEFDIFEIFNTRASRHWGFPLGLSLVYKQVIELNIEVRWRDERALAIKGEFEF